DTRAAFARRANRDQYRRWCSGDQHPPVVQRLSQPATVACRHRQGILQHQSAIPDRAGRPDRQRRLQRQRRSDNFFAALSEASSTPESIALRQQIIGEAKQLAQRFNGLNSNIGTQLNALKGQRVAMTSEINGLSGNIAELNAQIREMESTGRDTATLRDYRENLVKE